ncbi:MAG: O-antigen ligase family protein [Bacteroidota bacterium]
MKRLFIIKDTPANKISYYHIAFFLVALPFDRFYSELILISFLLHSLIHSNRQRFRSAFTIQNLLVSSVFFVTAIGILYSHDKAQGIKDLQRQSAIILFPFLFSVSGLDWKKYRMNFLRIFAFTCVATILYLYIDAISIILYNKLPLRVLFTQVFLNHNFSSPVNIHATYLGMYCLLSGVVFLYSFLNERSRSWRIIYLLSILILLAGLVQLASKSVLISAIAIAVFFPFFMLKGVKRVSLITGMAIIGVFITCIIINISSFRSRYVTQFKDDLVQTSINNEILEPRIVRWRLALQLISQSPLYGHGSGSEKRLLNDSYFNNKLYNSYLHELNTHNQYLSIALKTGSLGLFVFLFTLFIAFLAAFYNRDILFGSFWAIVCIVSFSENVLDVNKGIFFYAFFFSLFIQSGKPFGRLSRSNGRRESHAYPRSVNKQENAAAVRSDNYV